MTFHELAEAILKESDIPLTSDEIWRIAIAKGLYMKLDKIGKTPVKDLKTNLYSISEEPDSIFVYSGKRPRRFFLRNKVDNEANEPEQEGTLAQSEPIAEIVEAGSNSIGEKNIKIKVNKFKKVEGAEIDLAPINIFIGTNNSGKSSFIQGIQFAISSCQTLELKRVNWRRAKGSRVLSLDSTDFLYTPTRNIENLYHGIKLTGSRRREDRKWISFDFTDGQDYTLVSISKGKNGGFTTYMEGRTLGQKLSNIDTPFCVYIPGIAGIPIQEKFEVPITIKKSAVRGDSNNFLRNIIYDISLDKDKWERFNKSLAAIYPGMKVVAEFDGNLSEFINVNIHYEGVLLPIDSIGTGALQTIQVFAYIEYFMPRIILLDEPDSHIHPTKQKELANELFLRTMDNPDLKVVFSTHSRYILEALENKANVIHFQNGKTYAGIKGSKILLDIGAADAEYLFSKKNLKYIIATEDKVDNVHEKKEFIKKFLLGNGLSEDEFVLHSYEGCTKVDFAKVLEGFVRKNIPNATVIIHFDRDQRIDSDITLSKLKTDCEKRGIPLFVTEFSEVENYFCQPAHINYCYSIELSECELIYRQAFSELESFTKEKISNYILRERPDLCKNEDGQPDIVTINTYAEDQYKTYAEILTPGKELLGRLKSILQNKKLSAQAILNPSQGLISSKFQEILSELNTPAS